MIDPRILTGPALIVIGGFLVTIALRLYIVHPVNRVFRLGPFVTERGLVAVLRMRVIFLCYGMFFLTQGMTSTTYWFVVSQDVDNPFVVAFGSFGAAFAIGAAYFTLVAAWRLWRLK